MKHLANAIMLEALYHLCTNTEDNIDRKESFVDWLEFVGNECRYIARDLY